MICRIEPVVRLLAIPFVIWDIARLPINLSQVNFSLTQVAIRSDSSGDFHADLASD